MKRFLSFFGILALILLGVGIGVLYMALKTKPLIIGQDAAVSYVSADELSSSLKTDAGNYIDIHSTSENADILFIFYPGGLVRPQAYEWLGVLLAPIGVRTLIPEMPFDLAVTAINRADKLIEKYPAKTVIIGGHSLGGAMAARYALKHAEKLKGLVLMGAFSAKTDDLSKFDLATLVLAAQNDGLATLAEVRDGLKRLPKPQLVEIPGSVHAFFGRYGPQQGDGIPTVSRDQAEDDIATILRAYFEDLRN